MTKTLELNDQQFETLKMLLESERIDMTTSRSYNTIINQILDKMIDPEILPEEIISSF